MVEIFKFGPENKGLTFMVGAKFLGEVCFDTALIVLLEKCDISKMHETIEVR